MTQTLEVPATTIPAHIEEEIEEFSRRAAAVLAGEEDDESFKPYRLSFGIYGQRQPGYQMVRVKIPHGRLSGIQLEALASFSETFCEPGEYPGGGGRGMGHITTRQDVQFHFVPLHRVPAAMRHLAEAGLTTREACYNTVRNITGCPLAGACGDELFDVTPYAQAATELFLRNPICQNLPRKFKIAFSGCESDCAFGAIHDIGAVARVENGVRGFRVWVGGGLGNTPRPAKLLYDFVDARGFYEVAESIVRVFDAEGMRKNRNRARLKFIFDKQHDLDSFRARVEQERAALAEDAWSKRIGRELEERVGREAERRERVRPQPLSRDEIQRGPGYARWRVTNVGSHRMPGYAVVTVRLTLGDLTSDQFRALAETARRFSGDEARTSLMQNVLLRDVGIDQLPALYDLLQPAGLAESEARGARDIVTCPSGDTCNLGITSSRGLGRALGRWLDADGLRDAPEMAGTSFKASGCPNSCGQHHVATIGFYGNSKHVGDEPVPHYMMLVGGGVDPSGATIGDSLMKIPARRVPAAMQRMVGRYRQERGEGELFAQWVARADRAALKELLDDLALSDVPGPDELVGWDQDKAFTCKIGEGECAAV